MDFIADLRQADSGLAKVPVGRRVLVIGGGMTAIDVATQARLLGAQDVTIAYRRGRENMNASDMSSRTSHPRRASISGTG